MKRLLSFVIVCILAIGLAACSSTETPQAEAPTAQELAPAVISMAASTQQPTLQLSLPASIQWEPASDTQGTFLKNGTEIGGILLQKEQNIIPYIPIGELDAAKDTILSTLETAGITNIEWTMGGSSEYGPLEMEIGNGSEEYTVFVLGNKAPQYLLWMRGGQLSDDEQTAILANFEKNTYTEEELEAMQQADLEAVAKSMEGKNYQLSVDLPGGTVTRPVGPHGALFFANEESTTPIGGYEILHFQKGILPNAEENKALIMDTLKDSLMDSFDFSEYTGDMTDTKWITVVFSKGEHAYTHQILFFGQNETQYDLWFDNNLLDADTMKETALMAQLNEIQ